MGKPAEKKIDEILSKFNVNKYPDYHLGPVVLTCSKKGSSKVGTFYYSSDTLNTNSSKLISETL